MAQTETASLSADSAETILYSNDHARVTRRTGPDGKSVVVKQALGAQAIRRLAHEADMLSAASISAGLRSDDGVAARPPG